MPDLRILHTSDLLLGIKENDDAFAEITKRLIKHMPGDIDYIVISGNLTADGKRPSFENAEKAVMRLAGGVLKRDSDGLRLNRLLIVPGRRDTQNGATFSAFQDFHDRFFASEIERGRVQPFRPDEAIFRGLRDVSLIGLSYWRPRPAEKLRLGVNDLAAATEQALQRLLAIDFTKAAPTLVASAENVIFNGETDQEPIFRALRMLLRESFMKVIHLFGAGDALVSLPNSRTFDAVGLGTGPKRADGVWPFVANLVEISRPPISERGREQEGPSLVSTLIHQSGPRLPLAFDECVRGDLDRLYDRDPPIDRADTYTPLLQTIEDELQSRPHIIIRGYPGAGKLSFFKFMATRQKLVKQKIDVLPLELKPEEKIDDRVAEVEAFHHRERPRDVRPMLVIYDGRRASLRHDEKGTLRPLNRIFPHDLFVLLLRPEDSFTVVADRDVDREPVLYFPPLKDGVKNLVREFSSWVPADEREIIAITGGFAGFSELVLSDVGEPFSRKSGADPILAGITTELLDDAIVEGGNLVAEEAERHRQMLKYTKLVGGAICDYIQEKVDKKRGQGAAANALAPIEIEVSELKARLAGDEGSLNSVDRDLVDLSRSQILGPKERRGTEIVYRVEVLAPFVMHGATRTAPVKPLPRWPRVEDSDLRGTADILIVTAARDEHEAVLRKLQNRRPIAPARDIEPASHFSKLPTTAGDRLAVVNVAAAQQQGGALRDAVLRWQPRALLFVGVAAGVHDSGVEPGDVVVADQVACYTSDADPPWRLIAAEPYLLAASQRVDVQACGPLVEVKRPAEGSSSLHVQSVVVHDRTINDAALLRAYPDALPPVGAIEEEGWAPLMGALDASDSRKVLVIRGVCELADAPGPWPEVSWREHACDLAASYAIALLLIDPSKGREEKR